MKDDDADTPIEIFPPEKSRKYVINSDESKPTGQPSRVIHVHMGLPDTVKEISNLIRSHRMMTWFVLITSATVALVMAFTQAAGTPVALELFSTLATAKG